MKGKKGFQKGHPDFTNGRGGFKKGMTPWNKKEIDRDWLYNKYVNEKLSAEKIADLLNCWQTTILDRLKVFGIKARSLSDAHKGKILSLEHRKNIGKAISGENHPMYGKRHTEKSLKKMSEIKKGKKPSIETRKK